MFKKSIIVALWLIFTMPGAQAKDTYTFGGVIKAYLYNQSDEQRLKAYQNFSEHLAKEIGAPVVFHPYKRYADMIDALENNKIDIAYYKTGDYLQSDLGKKKLSPLVTVLVGKKEFYKTYLITKSPHLKTLASLRDKSLGFNAAWMSLSGHAYPLMYFHQHHIDIKKHFQTIKFYDGSACAIKALKNNDVDAITLWDDSLFQNLKKDEYHIIATIGQIPNSVIVASSQMSRSNRERLKKGLLDLPPEAFKGLTFSGVEKYNANHYKSARLLLKQVRQLYPSLYKKIDAVPKNNQFHSCA
jgi:phosphate/phosphite/phosphonate ABC transporter binding protein